MLLTNDEFQEVIDKLEDVKRRIIRANIAEDEIVLNDLLGRLGFSLVEKEVRDDWKIFLCAGTQTSKDEIMKVFNDYQLSDRVEMELDYKKMKGTNFPKFRDSQSYKYIIFGQVPHKVKGIGEYGGIISRMQSEPEHYPEVLVMTDSQGKPHLSISELRKAVEYIFINKDSA